LSSFLILINITSTKPLQATPDVLEKHVSFTVFYHKNHYCKHTVLRKVKRN